MAKKLNFEQSMDRLEEIVNALERGDAPLDESLALFQEGAKLIRNCTDALDKAQQQVSLLTKTENGPAEEAFAGAED
ncbi:MAG: exodeoxyribonuclease VII small subunit [Clostridia bacterium]|nr:exodeoxyribonuclease VII small subunit [Clostridia bacterium]